MKNVPNFLQNVKKYQKDKIHSATYPLVQVEDYFGSFALSAFSSLLGWLLQLLHLCKKEQILLKNDNQISSH